MELSKREKAFKLHDYFKNIKPEIEIISDGWVRRMIDEELLKYFDEIYEKTKKIAKKHDYSKLPKDV